MKRRVLLSILAFFGCLCLFAQTSNNPQKVPTTKELSNTVKSLTEKTEKLSSDNQALTKEIEELSGQIKKLKEDVEIYRGDVRTGISNYYDRLNNWLVGLSLLFAVFGLIAPYFVNKGYEKKFDSSLDSIHAQLNEASKKTKEVEVLKKQIDEIKATVEKKTIEAEESAKKALASQLFSEALSETDPQRKLILYTKVIELDPQKTKAYNNRGCAKGLLNDQESAIDDFNKAIEMNPEYILAYNNRALSYKKLAEETKDAEKRKEYLAKAKADEEKAKSLEEKN